MKQVNSKKFFDGADLTIEKFAATLAVISFTFYGLRHLLTNLSVQQYDISVINIESNLSNMSQTTIIYLLLPVCAAFFITYFTNLGALLKSAGKLSAVIKNNILTTIRIIFIVILAFLILCYFADDMLLNTISSIIFLFTLFIMIHASNIPKLTAFNMSYIIMALALVIIANYNIKSQPKILYNVYYTNEMGEITFMKAGNYSISGDLIYINDKEIVVPRSTVILYKKSEE